MLGEQNCNVATLSSQFPTEKIDASIKEYFDYKFGELEIHNKERKEALVKQIDGFSNGVRKLANRQDILAEENRVLKFEVNRLNNAFKFQLGNKNADHLLMFNCPYLQDESAESLMKEILAMFEICRTSNKEAPVKKEDLVSAQRMGNFKPGKIAPIMMKLRTPALKKDIFPIAKMLFQRFKVSISNDYAPYQREELFKVRETRNLLLQSNIECQIKGFDLVINNSAYNWEAARRYLARIQQAGEGSFHLSQELSQNQAQAHPRQDFRSSAAGNFTDRTLANKRKANKSLRLDEARRRSARISQGTSSPGPFSTLPAISMDSPNTSLDNEGI